jgi:hypothetical protein
MTSAPATAAVERIGTRERMFMPPRCGYEPIQ